LLDVQTPQSLANFCRHSPTVAAKILCWEGERQGGIRQVLESLRDAGSYVVLIGPEGGWTGAEVELARTHGFVSVSLGPRVLRTETAAIAITSLIRYSRGDLEPYGERG
jgi:16S rRNA (uracil1498-N3)-methyltransferase